MATQTKTQSQATAGQTMAPSEDKLGAIFKDNTNGTISLLTPAEEEEGGNSVMKPAFHTSGKEVIKTPYTDLINTLIPRFPDSQHNVEKGGEFLCGWGAAFINITVTFPINKTIFRQQLLGISVYRAMRQLKSEGLRNLYRGLLPPLMLKTTTMSIMFGSYKKFQLELDKAFPTVPRPVNHAMAAMMAGTLEATLTPFERIQTLLQDRNYHQRFNNTFHAARELWAFGFREYYRGLTVILLRNGPSNVMFFLGKEFVNNHLPALDKDSSHIVKDFLCGACLGALISTGFYPFNVIKTRMQSRLGGAFPSVRQSFGEVWVERNRSVSSLFRGFHLNYTRSFLSWGIINASYEYLMRLYRRARAEGCL